MIRDITTLRDLAKRTLEAANHPIMDQRRALWADFHSMRSRRVPIYILDAHFAWKEFGQPPLQCENELYRLCEKWMLFNLHHATYGDDYILEPWHTVYFPAFKNTNPHWENYGFEIECHFVEQTYGRHYSNPPIKTAADLACVDTSMGEVDLAKTEEKVDMLREAFGGLLEVHADLYPPKVANLSNTLGRLVGPENLLYLLVDEPDMMHRLCRMISDASMAIMTEAEKKGYFTTRSHTVYGTHIQAPQYSHELPNPGPLRSIPLCEHWIYDSAQEFECVSPAMWNEFCWQYQKPIYARFGLVAHGCCENLTHKIKYLKELPNLRRVAVTPWADTEACAAQLTDQYCISWRPQPSEMVSSGFDETFIKAKIKEAKEIFDRYNCFWEINLKDIITVQNDPGRLARWVRVVREALEE
ncbi:MAG: hypothetical protein FWD16_03335 [Clostridia bacterium]|nr:hypothetical protein [Clostridia bacterium]